MKKKRTLVKAGATLAIWIIAALLLDNYIVVPDLLELILAGLILLHATLSTIAIWWIPAALPTRTQPEETHQKKTQQVTIALHPLSRTESARWWKGAFLCLFINLAVLPLWCWLQHAPHDLLLSLYTTLQLLLALPLFYLFIFCLWHWRTRYAGKHHLMWPILFVTTAWPYFSTLPGAIITTAIYTLLHVLPDARGTGAYATTRILSIHQPATPLPSPSQLKQSACTVIGWLLIAGGLVTTIITCVAYFIIWNLFEDTAAQQIGKPFSTSTADTLYAASQVGKVSVTTALLAVLAATVGTLLLQLSRKTNQTECNEQSLKENRS